MLTHTLLLLLLRYSALLQSYHTTLLLCFASVFILTKLLQDSLYKPNCGNDWCIGAQRGEYDVIASLVVVAT